MPETIPGKIITKCPPCRGTGQVYDLGVSLLEQHTTGEPMRPAGPVDCTVCGGSGRGETVEVGQQ